MLNLIDDPRVENIERLASAANMTALEEIIIQSAGLGEHELQGYAEHLHAQCKENEAVTEARAAFGSMVQVDVRLVLGATD